MYALNPMSLNPLKRVKFISIEGRWKEKKRLGISLNPLKRVKFISIVKALKKIKGNAQNSLNPLKRVKFISIS